MIAKVLFSLNSNKGYIQGKKLTLKQITYEQLFYSWEICDSTHLFWNLEGTENYIQRNKLSFSSR